MIAAARNSENTPDNPGSTGTELIGRKPGAQPGNRNQWRHGLYSAKSRYSYVDRQVRVFRRAVEDALLDASGSIGVREAALVHTCVEACRSALTNRKRLEDAGEVTDEIWLAYERQYLQALDVRDRKIKELLPANNPFASLYGRGKA